MKQKNLVANLAFILALLYILSPQVNSVPLTYQATPDLEWLFDPTTEGTFTNGQQYQRELQNGNPRLFYGKYLDTAQTNFKRPRRLWNGNIFEGEEINVAEPNANLNLGTYFGLGMWIYIMEINATATHTLFCKQQPNATDPGYQLCLQFTASNFFWTVKDTSVGQNISLARNDTDQIDVVQMTDMVPQQRNITSFGGYYFCDNLKSYNQTRTYKSVYAWTDDPLNYISVGAMMGTLTKTVDPFIGIIQHIQIYKKNLGKFQIFDQSTYKCQPYCNLCKVSDIPMCIQQYERSVLGWYDFSPPKWTFWTYVLQDLSRFNRPLNPLTVDTYANEPTNTTEPVYVDRQGLYFDHPAKFLLRPNFQFNNHPTLSNANGNVRSFTCEVWLRFNYSTSIVNNMFVVRKMNGANYFAMSFELGPQAAVSMNAITLYQPVTLQNATWYFFGASIMKINNFQSRYCLLFYDVWSCKIFNQIFTDTNKAADLRIGEGFLGIIRKVKLFEYPKILLEMQHNQRLAYNGACLPFDGRMCLQCDIESKSNDTDFRYKCYSDCMEHQWEDDCRECHKDCRTCHGSDEYHCLSCYDWDMDLHWPGHRCIEECGDGKQQGYHECDDGNLNNGDGCSNYCKIERGWYCEGGTPTTADTCYEICGDSKRVLQACDDGNAVSSDGCSSTCLVETGYTCSGGSVTYRDICFETCGDGMNRGNYECDDGNTANNDGCTQACKIELGWKCSGGNFTAPDTCTEICGDGMDRGSLGCDDSNLVNGDGCSSTCSVEFGWKCYAISQLLPSICYKISWPKLIDYYIVDNKALYLKFNETVVIGSTWNESDWSIEIDGPIPPYNFQWSLYNQNGLKTTPDNPIIINLTIPSQLYGLEQLYFKFLNQKTLLSGTYSTQTEETGFVLDLEPQDDTSGEDCGTSSYRAIIFALLYLNFGLAILSAMFLQTTTVLFHLLSNIQILSMAAMYQAVYPTCLVNFMKTMMQVGLKFTLIGGSLTSGFVENDSFSNIPIDYKFKRIGYTSSSVLQQSGDLIILWAALFVLYCIFFAVEFVLQSVPYIRSLCQRYRYNFFVAGMNFTFIKMSFDTTYSFLYMSAENSNQKISVASSVCMGVFILCYPAYLAYQGGVYSRELSESVSDDKVTSVRATHIFVEYDSSHPTCYHYLLAQCVKKALFVALALLMWKQYCYALTISVVIQFVSLMYLTYVRPFKANLNNVMIIFEEFMTLVCFLVLIRYANKDSVVSFDTSKEYAKMFAFYVMVLCIVPPILAFMEFVRMLRYIRDICNWKRDFNEEKDSNESSVPSDNEQESEDLLKGQHTEDSLVEKEISISSSSEEYNPKRPDEDKEPDSFERDDNNREEEQQVEDESEDEPPQEQPKQPVQQPQSRPQPTFLAPPTTKQPTPQIQQKPKEKTPPPKAPTPVSNFQALDFSQVPDDAAKVKERLPDLKNTPQNKDDE